MATYVPRGNTHSVTFTFKNEAGEVRQHWETYATELEAIQRKAYIDFLQKGKKRAELLETILEYKNKRAEERVAQQAKKIGVDVTESSMSSSADNTCKTYKEFAEKWLLFHARKQRLSPNTYDSYVGNLKNHIYPYFGDRIMSTIKTEDVDNFLDYLSRKPCAGSKANMKNPKDAPTLSSATVKKCYNILTAGFPVAKKWRYIREIPETTAPSERFQRRKAWDQERVFSFLCDIKEDKLLHLAVHIAFVCSLRAGETAGIDAGTVDFHDRSIWITQEVQRVSDESLKVIPKNEVIRIFPKVKESATSSLILKGPKTEGSTRKNYLTTPLLNEIKERLDQINRDKEFFGAEYQDYGLLLCHADGRPIEPSYFGDAFRIWQGKLGIEDRIEFQGLRKSGQMHKVRLTQNNYKLVAANAGHSEAVLMSNYDEALDSEKRTLSLLVETSFYPKPVLQTPKPATDLSAILLAIQNDPEIAGQLMQALLSKAVGAL